MEKADLLYEIPESLFPAVGTKPGPVNVQIAQYTNDFLEYVTEEIRLWKYCLNEFGADSVLPYDLQDRTSCLSEWFRSL